LTKTRIVVYLSLFLAMAGFGITIPILPFIARDLGASPVEVSLLISLFAMAQFLSGPVWGSMSDRFGRRRMLVVGLLGYALSFVLAGLSRSLPALIGSRALGGLLSASIFPSSQALIADVTEPADRGPAMAAMGAWINLGFLFGPVVGGALSAFGQRTPMFVAGGVVAATALLAAVQLIEPSRAAGGGARGRTGATALRSAWPRPADIAEAVTSPISPYLWLTFAVSFSQSGLTALLGYFVMDRFGGTSFDAGTIFTSVGLTGFLMQSLLVGRLIRRFGEHRLSLWGTAVCVAGFLLLLPAADLAATVGAAVVISLGTSVLRPSLTSAVSCRTPLPQGLTMGVQSSLDSLGRMTGPVVGGWMYGFSLTLPFWSAAAVMGTVGGFAALRPGTTPGRESDLGRGRVPVAGSAAAAAWRQASPPDAGSARQEDPPRERSQGPMTAREPDRGS